MLGELLVWLGVVMVAYAAWTLYSTNDSVPQDVDQEPFRRRED
jgi:hypothetical protein